MSFSDIISSLFGAVPPSVQKESTAFQQPEEVLQSSKPTSYPSHEDAQFAKKYDYSYGQPWAPEFNDQIMHLLSGGVQAVNNPPFKIFGMPQTELMRSEFANKDIPDFYARAALATQRSGLASLGFDPMKVGLDVAHAPGTTNLAGLTYPQLDQIYSNQQYPSNIVHESIHRGIDKLRETPYWKPDFNKLDDEMVVRALMQQRMGNPEAGRGTTGDEEIASSKKIFSDPRQQNLLDQLDMAASQYLAAKHPGGPR